MTDRPAPDLPRTPKFRRAVELYVQEAFVDSAPERAWQFMPPADCELSSWLMEERIERDPRGAGLAGVRSFALRIGNDLYPHMKLRLSRPPHENGYVLSVDAHDACLEAPADSDEASELEELKRHNSSVASAVYAAWEAHGLPTERTYLRRKIRQARSASHCAPTDPGAPGRGA